MISKIEAARFVSAYLSRASKYDAEQWIVTVYREFEHCWEVFVSDGDFTGEDPPTTGAFVLLVGKAEGKIYRPLLTSVERSISLIATDPKSLRAVFEPEDLDDEL